MNFPNCTRDLIEMFPEPIGLDSDDFDRAREISDLRESETRQWQVYLNVLAVLALEKWLKVRLRDKSIVWQDCAFLQPKLANFIDAVSPINVGDFRLCLVVMESFADEVVTVPRAAIELPEFAAHFYIAIEVLEEEEEAILRGILRRDRLLAYQEQLQATGQSYPFSSTSDWSEDIPLAWFDSQLDRLLYDCRYLDPQEIPLPAAVPIPDWTRGQLREFLLALQPAEPQPWRRLDWERGQIALRYPELLDVEMAALPSEALHSLEALLAHLRQPTLVRESVRLSNWLRRSFEEGWQEIQGILTPREFSPVRGLGEVRGFSEVRKLELRRKTDTGNSATPEAIAAVIELLQPDRPEDTRCKAAGVLGEIGVGSAEAAAALTELLHAARSEETRWEAALSLGKVAPNHPLAGVKRARLIDLGAQLEGYRVVLSVAIVPKMDGRLGIWLEVQPAGELTVLPPELKLSVLSPSGKVRMEAESRSDETGRGKDSAISQYFSIGTGKRFQVRVSLGDARIAESFVV